MKTFLNSTLANELISKIFFVEGLLKTYEWFISNTRKLVLCSAGKNLAHILYEKEVNLGKIGGKDWVFWGQAWLLRGATLLAKENPILMDSLTQIYIIFLIRFRITPAKMHG